MTKLEALLDPTGSAERSDDVTLAPRPGTLKGLSVGLLDNTKVNATPLLKSIAAELDRRYGLGASIVYTKDYFGTPIKEELLEQIVSECDAVITAVGDCGSCSAATVADGILFERAGLPAVSICSDSFLISGQAMAKVQGFPGYDFLVAAHPIASLDADEIRGRAADLMLGIQRIFGLES
ncbi:UGSC family (seleno)protein [Cryobacterium sp. SO1]|uniref:UGSC family (seleno)protein n=1 Tax=Cryobacterium sp. SO1 TaxID=1897061 RepID=UPI00102385CA|nr:UGSC family (seleno)protein [Cryobacterium sp. SO1]RZI35235.1 hypothetical protein BJQ95_02301 [Cryobacterium sp. SO1]